jgi:hypothetical protein
MYKLIVRTTDHTFADDLKAAGIEGITVRERSKKPDGVTKQTIKKIRCWYPRVRNIWWCVLALEIQVLALGFTLLFLR